MPTVTNSGEEKNEQSRLSSFVGAIAVADLVKSTLGPKGMDKIQFPVNRGQRTMKSWLTSKLTTNGNPMVSLRE